MSNSLSLSEASTQRVRLSVEQAAELQRLGRELRGNKLFYRDIEETDEDEEEKKEASVISCTRIHDDVYSVKVSNAVGAIGLPGLTVSVLPKIPVEHFAHVAKRAVAQSRMGFEEVSVGSLDAFWELIANWCVTSVEKVLRAGLISDYRPETDDLSLVRGRVDVRRTTQNFVQGRLQARCTFDEFDINNSLNRVLRTAMRVIASTSRVSDETLKKRAARMDRAMEGVGQLERADLGVRTDRRSHRYTDALDFSLRVLGPLGVNVAHANQAGRTFLIPTAGLMEDGLRAVIADALSPHEVRAGKKIVSSSPYFSVNPDIVIDNGVVTGDVKYKLAGPSWVRQDVAQGALFATGYGAQAAFIATFSTKASVTDLDMNLGHLPIHRIVWKAIEGSEPSEAEREFIERIRSVLRPFLALRSVA
jgi:hypothetical protein